MRRSKHKRQLIQLRHMTTVCTLATINSIQDLKVFLFTLEQFNTVKPTVYLLCDTATDNILKEKKTIQYSGIIHSDTGLDKYNTVNRKIMVNQPGINYKTLWEDFMMEKATVIDNAFNNGAANVFFFDSDICFMGPLPDVPEKIKIGVCHHMIKPADEAKYGKYNGGYIWTSDRSVTEFWRQASKTSRFYDQAALEDVVAKYKTEEVYEFPIQNNYGWWRMYQSVESFQNQQKSWSIFRNEPVLTAGIRINGKPLLSIHTHWLESNDIITKQFNLWTYYMLLRLGKHGPAQTICKFLSKEFPNLNN